MKNTVVYADLTFLVNFFMDLVLLWVTIRLVGISLRYLRLLAVSLVAALYGTGCLFPSLQLLYCLPLKLIISLLLVWMALHPAPWTQLRKGLVYFYLLSFAAAGAAQALSYMITVNPSWIHASWLWLGAGMFCLLLIGYRGNQFLVRRLVPGLLRYTVLIKFDDQICSAQAFMDTGNGLCDPLTHRPVIVAEYGIIRGCLPRDLQEALDEHSNGADMIDAVTYSAWASRLRLIPFRSVGQRHGMMVGLRADEVVVRINEQDVIYRDLVIGIYHDRLSSDESYRMLIPSALVIES
ncbi:MAG TPA: sigma-E processing peptidase SpoIIGA [Syntrophomonadaceae bacterium]|nr:sigma-E processing peptidase SpoIIGA [Syntrophomonadaceae bacterium]